MHFDLWAHLILPAAEPQALTTTWWERMRQSRERDGNRELLHGNQLDDRQVWGQHCPAIREWHDGNMLLIPYSLPGDRKTRCCCLTELQLRGSPLLPFPRHLLPCNYQHIRKKKKNPNSVTWTCMCGERNCTGTVSEWWLTDRDQKIGQCSARVSRRAD